jgi:6-phosphogluconate dehydrogenase
MGNASAGHYVKMVHNGIEYGMMQLIAETYDLLKNGLGYTNIEISEIFTTWNKGKLSGFLIESAAYVLLQMDPTNGGHLIDFIKDIARSKGTGKWTSQEAMDLQVPVPTIDMAVAARDLSAYANSRDKISGYKNTSDKDIRKDIEVEDIQSALLACFTLTYIQGLHLIRVASRAYNYNTEMKDVVNNWREGCIIRSGLLETFEKVYLTEGFDGMILADEDIYKLVTKHMPKLKKVVLFALQNDFGSSTYVASATYYNMMSTKLSPMNLIQGLRDLFGAHTFERTDQEGVFHHIWK